MIELLGPTPTHEDDAEMESNLGIPGPALNYGDGAEERAAEVVSEFQLCQLLTEANKGKVEEC